MSDTVRAFLAIGCPANAALVAMRARLEAMKPAVRLGPADQWHVTLQFLGDIPCDGVVPITAALHTAAQGVAAFRVPLLGIGVFPSLARPSVVWAGAKDDGRLGELFERIAVQLAALGFARESRPFHPHVTLARVVRRPPPELAEIVREHQSAEFGMLDVTTVDLMRSDLSREGSVYTRLARVELAHGL